MRIIMVQPQQVVAVERLRLPEQEHLGLEVEEEVIPMAQAVQEVVE